MPNDDYPPFVARRLRDAMRLDGVPGHDVPDEGLAPQAVQGDRIVSSTDHGSAVDPTPDSPDEPVIAAPGQTRRWRRSRNDISDSVQIGGDVGHAWWADREALDKLVNPKKRGAAERARRAAETAFAPKGTRVRPDPTRARENGSSAGAAWSPADVFSWSPAEDAAPEPESTPPSPGLPAAPTPWQVLGLTSDASWREVTRRHRHLALEHHPDRHGGSDAERLDLAVNRMSDINAAFSELRRIYQVTDGL